MSPTEFYKLLESRKSIRQYKSESVPKETIERILSAGMQAPSGKNRQNWQFYVLRGQMLKEYLKYSQQSWTFIKDILKEKLKPSLYDFTERFFFTLGNAPVVVLVFSENTKEEKYLTSVGSVYMAVENINLAAVAEGLGCCTMGAPLEIEQQIYKFLKIDKDLSIANKEKQLLCAITIGYPDHNPPKAKRVTENKIIWLDELNER